MKVSAQILEHLSKGGFVVGRNSFTLAFILSGAVSKLAQFDSKL